MQKNNPVPGTTFKKGAILFAASIILLAGCKQDTFLEPEPASVDAVHQNDIHAANARSAASVAAVNFVAPLSGEEEVPAADTKARGNATFQLKDDGLHYRLIVANIENVTMAHIHLAPSGVNGPVVAWLYPSGPPPMLIPGSSNGVLATGIITSDQLVGPLAGASLNDLLEAMRNEGTYVNVHTSQFPGGEIRGQIRPAGRK